MTYSNACSSTTSKRVRNGQGTHIITIIRKLMEDKENWETITDNSSTSFQAILITVKCNECYIHLIPENWYSHVTAICIFCGMVYSFPKVAGTRRVITITTDDVEEHLLYRIAPCNGVKMCPHPECKYTVSVSAQRPCCSHTALKLV